MSKSRIDMYSSWIGENSCLVHPKLCGLPDVLLLQRTSTQTPKALAGFADSGADLPVDEATVGQHSEALEVIHGLQLSSFN